MFRKSLTNDFWFKRFISSLKNKKVVIKSLEKILKRNIKDIKVVVEKVTKKEIKEEKLCRFDAYIEIDDDEIVIIEMQNKEEKDMQDRIITYMGKVEKETLEKGQTYSKKKKISAILFTNYKLYKEGDIYEVTKLIRSFEAKIFSDKLNIYNIDLKNYSNN